MPTNSTNGGNTVSSKSFWYYLLQVVRVLVGLLFIFSGLIKANDPSGLAYKMQEFFEAWHMTFLSPMALTLAIIMIIFEIIAGVAMLLGYFYKVFSFLILLLMIFFLFLTAYATFSGKIKECGCFGDCIPLEAIQSFWKDVVLLALVLVLFLGRKYIHPLFKGSTGTLVMLVCLLLSGGIQWYVLEHLPFVDCLPYANGKNLWQEMQMPANATPDIYETIYQLKNKISGEEKTMTDQEYISTEIWKDSATWEIVGDPIQKLIKKGNNLPKIQDFQIMDYEGQDHTEPILRDPGYNFLLFIKDVDKANPKNMDRIKSIADEAKANNIGFYVLSSSAEDATEAFLNQYKIAAPAFSIDGTVCKTALRSNPGLMLIKAGTVKGKWSYNDYPKGFNWANDQHMILK